MCLWPVSAFSPTTPSLCSLLSPSSLPSQVCSPSPPGVSYYLSTPSRPGPHLAPPVARVLSFAQPPTSPSHPRPATTSSASDARHRTSSGCGWVPSSGPASPARGAPLGKGGDPGARGWEEVVEECSVHQPHFPGARPRSCVLESRMPGSSFHPARFNSVSGSPNFLLLEPRRSCHVDPADPYTPLPNRNQVAERDLP